MNGQRWRTVVESACLVLALVAGAVAPTQAQPGPVVTEYYHVDAVGSVRVVTDDRGVVVRRYDFAPFGEQDSPCTSSPDARLFTGHERDRETCLDYLGARHYRSTDGRFPTLDPALDASAALVDPQRWSRYAYANNNPLKYVDPSVVAYVRRAFCAGTTCTIRERCSEAQAWKLSVTRIARP